MELQRTEMVLGKDFVKEISNKRVIVFGVGGVGGATCEALARLGVNQIAFVDNDVVDSTNINRQIIALSTNVGSKKVDEVKKRLSDINPDGDFIGIYATVNEEWTNSFDFSNYDAIIDCIDSVSGKLALYEISRKENIELLSSMGTGNKIDPTKLEVTTLEETQGCPLARVLRKECRKRQLLGIKVVYSTEQPKRIYEEGEEKSATPGSTPFVPPVAGYILVSELCRIWKREFEGEGEL